MVVEDGRKMIRMIQGDLPRHSCSFGGGNDRAVYVRVKNMKHSWYIEQLTIALFDGNSASYNENLNGYNYLFYAWGNLYHRLARGNGTSAEWLTDQIPATPAQQNNYYELEARWLDAGSADGDNLIGMVDGKIPGTTGRLEARDDEYTSKSYLGFASWGYAEWRVDRVIVRKSASIEPVARLDGNLKKPDYPQTPAPTPTAEITTFQYDENNKLTGITNPDLTTETMSYDDNGQLVRREKSTGEVTTYEWNDQGMLVKVILPNGVPITYRYDGNGNLVGRITPDGDVSFIPEAMYFEKMIDRESGRTISFNLASNLGACDGNGENGIFYLQDHLGSNIMTMNNNGEIINSFNYDAYGNTMGSEGMSNENRLFVGTYGILYDSHSELHLMGARWYDKSIMRFISPDTLMGINRYSYVDGNPINFVDISGLEEISIEEAIRRFNIYRRNVYRERINNDPNINMTLIRNPKSGDIYRIKANERIMQIKWEVFAPLTARDIERLNRMRRALAKIGTKGKFDSNNRDNAYACIDIPMITMESNKNKPNEFLDKTRDWAAKEGKKIFSSIFPDGKPSDIPNELDFFINKDKKYKKYVGARFVPVQAAFVYYYQEIDNQQYIYSPGEIIPVPGMWAAYYGGEHSGVVGLDENGNLVHIMVTHPDNQGKLPPKAVLKAWSHYNPEKYFDYPFSSGKECQDSGWFRRR